MTYAFDLGAYSRPTDTTPAAQAWLDRGLIWMFGYNHEEAIKCFEQAIAADARLALAYWGIAYSLGPNYNKPWEGFTDDEKSPCLENAHKTIQDGLAQANAGTLEHALLQALLKRFPNDPDVEDFQPYLDDFADEMGVIYAGNPHDLEVVFAYAEALMGRTPWRLWDIFNGVPADGASTKIARKVLETAFESPAAWDHPGLLHMYIHLMEMSPTPQAALRHGDRLTGLCPDAGHLVHMATHIDVLCGDYQSVVARNHAAAAVDKKYKDYAGGQNFYSLYRIHNLHFEIYGAMFLAQKATALKAAERLRAEVPDEVVRVYPDLFEVYVAARPHVFVRFGMWAEILDEPLPEDTTLYASTNALILYSRAVALANLGRPDAARTEAAKFHAAYDAIPEERRLFQNKARDVLAVAREMMMGEVAFKGGDTSAGLDHLREAVRLDDSLYYEEPWAWPQPTRHALGALLLTAGHWDEAESVYRADLGLDGSIPRQLQNPNNIWALQGLLECLEHRGEAVERVHIKQQLDQAQARADIAVSASCFCRSSCPK